MDQLINSFFNNYSNNYLNLFMSIFSFIGSEYILLPLSLIVFLYLLYKKKNAFIFFATMTCGFISFILLKEIFHRVRPDNNIEVGYSFPSGHATMNIIFFSLIIYFFKDNIKNKILRISFIFSCALIIFLIGFSRIYLQVHWFSDVVAGYILGIFWFIIFKSKKVKYILFNF
ncbi:MAG TPA: phosphatase PAP2 family protein [Candidatus Nanoarchaeia archaeon]|nr:phosphatase PAP2 family protein [Candidatus Nanoarchaeia archaeon]